MNIPSDSEVNRKDININGELLFSDYIRTDNVQLQKFSSVSFRTSEILSFYDQYPTGSSLLKHPRNAKDIRDVFEHVDDKMESLDAISYGIFSSEGHDDLIGDVTVEPLDWNQNKAEVSFFLPDNEDLIPDVLASLVYVLINDLGFNIVSLTVTDDQEDELVNELVEELGGVYEGIERYVDQTGGIVGIEQEWSLTARELNGEGDFDRGIEYESDDQ